jgi:cleavage and polyadenylation specificity factor subunit 1
MFSLCKQSVPANGVEFAIKCRFFNNLEKSLVVGSANVIRVYRIIPDVALNSQEKFTGKYSNFIELQFN